MDQVHDLFAGAARVLPERAGELPGAPGEEVLQRGLLAPGTGQPLLGQRLGQRVHAVQRHPAHLPGNLAAYTAPIRVPYEKPR
ncbi:hypothetical protein SHKM778_39840 [Streptomyces sp. KM77-8]|uniref:Uncharacterized protein n=1 Tax=Streptomyces haneummycinicus TaxID=3074435 RepID=A0AAT9HJI8_9ACTN